MKHGYHRTGEIRRTSCHVEDMVRKTREKGEWKYSRECLGKVDIFTHFGSGCVVGIVS